MGLVVFEFSTTVDLAIVNSSEGIFFTVVAKDSDEGAAHSRREQSHTGVSIVTVKVF